jgi:outer membrane protein OmpA-like peptidoglycan-associated protein
MYLLLLLLVHAPVSAGTALAYRSADVEKLESAEESGPPGASAETNGAPAENQAVAMQRPVVALKNNLLYDAILTPNLTFEVKLAKRWTLQVEGGFNPFPLDDTKEHKWRHFLVDVEAKYWFCEAFHRDFIGVNVAYSHYNVAKGWYPIGWLYPAVKQNRFQGDAVMAGVSYGWSFPVSKHVAFELEAGVDAGYTWYGKYECPHCGALVAQERKWFAVPKAGVNISILLPAEDRDDCPCKYQKDEDLASSEQQQAETVEPAEPAEPTTTTEVEPVAPVQEPVEPVVVPVVVPEPEPVMSAPERLNSPLLAPYTQYKPYSTNDVLSRDSTALYIYFPTDSSVIDRAFANNGTVLDSILYLVSELMKDSLSEMKMIQIVGFASFDGPLKRNERLAQNRAKALKDYIQTNLNVPDSLFEVNSGGEAWSELVWAVEQSDYKLKNQVLRIIREEKDLNVRERRLREHNYGWTYVFLRDQLLARYRNAGYIKVYFDVPNSSATAK